MWKKTQYGWKPPLGTTTNLDTLPKVQQIKPEYRVNTDYPALAIYIVLGRLLNLS